MKDIPVTPVRKLLRKLPSFRRKSDGPIAKRVRRRPPHSPSENDKSRLPLFRKSVSTISLPHTPSDARKLDDVRRPVTDPRDPNTIKSGELRGKRARLAIQQHDENYDAVIVTTLPEFPFCCHEDLLTMSHSRLLRVADLFNSRLPSPTRIPHTEDATDADIRRSIEKLVGITPISQGELVQSTNTQDLQTTSNSTEDSQRMWISSPPSSPLAMHVSRKLNRDISWTRPLSNAHQMLDVLHEEDETEVVSLRRTRKKQKLDMNQAVPTSIEVNQAERKQR